jgi:hypothetical protein
MKRWALVILTLALGLVAERNASANAVVRGAYYRLGDDDPGAAPSLLGNNPTKDSFSDALDLTRFGAPHYTSDVPPRGPVPNSLAMSFFDPGAGALSTGYYGRTTSLGMVEQGYALEAWAKAPTPPILDPGGNGQLIAYNGTPTSNGFGLYRDASNYVARIGAFEQILGPANDNAWHHLAYVQSLGTSSYYFDGNLVKSTTKDPLPTVASGGFWLGGRSNGTLDADLFNGWIDEVRYQSFNPIAAGAFDPTNFLISSVPEPSMLVIFFVAAIIVARAPRPCSQRHGRGAHAT